MLRAERSHVGGRHRDEAGALVDDREGGIQVKQRNAWMNLPPGTARQRGGVASAQLKCVTGVGDGLVGLPNDHTIDAHATGYNPLFGASLGSVRMLQQQPIQEGPGVRFDHSSDHPASPSSRSAFDQEPRIICTGRDGLTSDRICDCAAGTKWSAWPFPGDADLRVDRNGIGGFPALPVWA